MLKRLRVVLFFLVFVVCVYILHLKHLQALRNGEEEDSANDLRQVKLDVKDRIVKQASPLDYSSSSNITYTRIHQFLLSTPQTVMRTTPPQFLTDVKNPCFALDENFVNIGNINLSYALKMNYEIRCLPYVYIAGFAKCGTSDLHHNLLNHHLIYGFLKENQLAEYEMAKASGEYKKHNILGQIELVQEPNDMHLKESDFWDNFRCVKNFTLDRLSRRCTPELIIRSHLKHGTASGGSKDNMDIGSQKQQQEKQWEDDLRNMVYIDSSPRMGEGHYSWSEEEVHWGEIAPSEFVPDRIHHATPQAKVIFMLREPVARTFSDYRFIESEPTAAEFHRKVVEAVDWWNKCRKRYRGSESKVCAYGNAPFGLPLHNTRSCALRGGWLSSYCSPYRHWGCASCIDRVRISMYHLYLQEWLRVFPRESVLFVRLEDMYADKKGTLEKILHFLELPPLRPNAEAKVLGKKPKNKTSGNIQMLNKTKEILEEFFKSFNTELSELLQQSMYEE